MNKTQYQASLTQRHDEVLREVEHLRAEVGRITEQLALREAHLRNLEELIRIEGMDPPAATARSDNGRAGPRFLDEAEVLLGDSRRPLHYLDIAKRLQSGGVFIPGKNPAANLLTRMTRDPRFRKTARGTYTLNKAQRRSTE